MRFPLEAGIGEIGFGVLWLVRKRKKFLPRMRLPSQAYVIEEFAENFCRDCPGWGFHRRLTSFLYVPFYVPVRRRVVFIGVGSSILSAQRIAVLEVLSS